MRRAGPGEIIASRLIEKLLLYCGKRAHARGDTHALKHVLAAIQAGNMGPRSHDDGCIANVVRAAVVKPSAEPQEGWAMLVDKRTGDVVSERKPVVFVEGKLPAVNFHRVSVAPYDATYLKVRVELANGRTIESEIGGAH